jgi:hypothetical protein
VSRLNRWTRRLALAVFGGLLMTVAAAWVAAAFLDITDGELQAHYGDNPPVAVPGYIGAPKDWHVRSWHACWGPGVRYDMVTEQEWIGSLPGMSEHTKPNRAMQRVTVGFPFPCMQWTTYKDDTMPAGAEKSPWYMGLDLPGKQLIAKRVERALPLRPLLAPFVVNTGVYAAAAFVSLTAIAALRASRRRRRGLCVRCAYPVNNLPRCPECATEVRTRS